MERFEVEVKGGNLGRAQLALNGAGIPTIASGADSGEPERPRTRGFFRSTGFWILLVILIAFFAQRLVSPAEDRDRVTYDEFLTQVEEAPGAIERVTLDPDDTSLEVDLVNGGEYRTGYPPDTEDFLVNTLRRQQVELVVEETGGGSLLSWLVYLLPFLLFFGFWLFLMKRMERRQDRGQGADAVGLRIDSLKGVVEADLPEQAADRVRGAVPPDGGYQLRNPKPQG